jgi:hypothetical protein
MFRNADSSLPFLDLSYDQRAAERLDCPLPTTVQLLATPEFQRLRVQIRDVSVKGVGLVSPRLLEIGARVALDWCFGPAEQWRTVLARVAHVTPLDGGAYAVGCEFDTFLSETDVRLVLCRFSSVLSFDA